MVSVGALSCGVIVCIDSVTDKPQGEQQRQIVSVSCFCFLLSRHDAIDIGCIDWAIIATLQTARVRGVGVGKACVHGALYSGRKIVLYRRSTATPLQEALSHRKYTPSPG